MEETHSNIRVSVVEDNHFIRLALEQILVNSDGYDVVAVYGSGEEAVDKMPQEIPDVVLMDINMGKMSGIEAVKILKEKCPSIKFMMCTVYEDDEKIFDALQLAQVGIY